MSLKNRPSSLFVQSMLKMKKFQHHMKTEHSTYRDSILPQFSLDRSYAHEHREGRLEFWSIRRAVSNMITSLREETDNTSVGRCQEHLDGLAKIQARFVRLSGTKLGNIPEILITKEMTMQSVFELYMKGMEEAWIMSDDIINSMIYYPVFDSMAMLLDLYKDWRLLEDAIRSCLYTIGTDDRRKLSGMELSK